MFTTTIRLFLFIVFPVCFICNTPSLFAQEPLPFIEDDKEWLVYRCQPGFAIFLPDTYHFYFFDGDTIIDDKVFTKMYTRERERPDVERGFVGAVLEENHKAYIHLNHFIYVKDTTLLLYDFSLEENDTISLPLYVFTIDGKISWNKHDCVVKNIELVELYGQKRKKWTLEWIDQDYPTIIWIEGIGTLKGPIHGGMEYLESIVEYRFLEAKNRNEIIFCNDEHEEVRCPRPIHECNSAVNAALIPKQETVQLEIITDAISQITTFQIVLEKATNISLEIYNLQGQQISKLINNEVLMVDKREEIWNWSDVNSGIYFAVLVVDGQVVKTQKLLVQ